MPKPTWDPADRWTLAFCAAALAIAFHAELLAVVRGWM